MRIDLFKHKSMKFIEICKQQITLAKMTRLQTQISEKRAKHIFSHHELKI